MVKPHARRSSYIRARAVELCLLGRELLVGEQPGAVQFLELARQRRVLPLRLILEWDLGYEESDS